MITEIAYQLISQYSGKLSFFDKWAGLVVPLKKMVDKTEKIFPVYINHVANCNNSQLMDLLPASDRKSVIYVEKNGEPTVEEIRSNYYIITAPIRLVCWYNLDKINGGLYLDEGVIINNILQNTPKGLEDSLFDYSKNVKIYFRGSSSGASLFDKYTYNEVKTQFTTFPYGAVALDFDIQYVMVKCSDPLAPFETCGQQQGFDCNCPPPLVDPIVAYTQSEKDKLAGIEDGAEVNDPEIDPIFNAWLVATPPAYHADIPTDISELTDSTNIIPDTTSDLTNDSGFITLGDIPAIVETDPVFNQWLSNTPPAYPADIPTNVSELNNDEGYITASDVPIDPDEKVKYAADDASAGYLGAKTVAGTGITLDEGTGADADKLKITNSAPDQVVSITAGTNIDSVSGSYPNFTINASTQTGTTDEKVKYDVNDTVAGYVSDKVIAGDGISVAEGTGANENKLVITNTDKGSDVDLSGLLDETAHDLLDHTGITGVLSAETDPDFNAWLIATPPLYTETDPDFNAWLIATPPLYAETDPVVGAVTGIVKANGAGTISAATADTDYATPTLAKQFALDVNRYGFVSRLETNLSFDGIDTITLADKGSGWSYYRAGVKYTISGNKTVPCATPMVDGTLYYIYIDSALGTLISGSGWTLNDTKVPVCTLYWDSTLTPKFVLADERHTCKIDRAYHREHHFADGTETRSPGTLSGLVAASDTDTDKVFSLTDASIFDEDLFFDIFDIAKPDGNTDVYPIVYRTGASSYKWVLSDMPFKYTDTAGTDPYGYIEYDNAGTSTPSALNRFVNTYVFLSNVVANNEADPEISTSSMRVFILQGRGSYTSSALAIAEKLVISAGFPVAEGVGVYQITWATTNRPDTVKGRCRYVSTQAINTNVTVSAIALDYLHNNLLGIDGGSIGEFYHLTAAQHAIATNAADTDNDGYLTQTDWDTFNSKQAALTFGIADTNAVKIDGATVSTGEIAKFTANGIVDATAGVDYSLPLTGIITTHDHPTSAFTYFI